MELPVWAVIILVGALGLEQVLPQLPIPANSMSQVIVLIIHVLAGLARGEGLKLPSVPPISSVKEVGPQVSEGKT